MALSPRISSAKKYLLPLFSAATCLGSTAWAQAVLPTSIPTAAPTAAATAISTPANFLQAEGIVGDVDKDHRGPLLSVSTEVTAGGVHILADTAILNSVFAKYPVQVDFFINRKLYSSQYRSPELPGPLGIDVPSTVATTPFNYTVVATLLHPNRTFTTVIQGAVFGNNLSKTFDCTLTLAASDGTTTDYIADKIGATQSAENGFTLSFTGIDDTGSKQVTAKASVTVSGDTATASVTTDQNTAPLGMSGTASSAGGSVDSVDLSTSDTTQSLNCSATQ